MARPTVYNEETANEIATRIAGGESLVAICRDGEGANVRGIYVLASNGVPFYVGQSVNIGKRYRQHINGTCGDGSTYRERFITREIEDGARVDCFILEEIPEGPMNAAEGAWIKRLRGIGIDLKNTADPENDHERLRAAKAAMPWGSRQAPLQKALIQVRDIAKRQNNPKMHAVAEGMKRQNNEWKRDPAVWITMNLEFVKRRPAMKTWDGVIEFAGELHG